MYATIRYFLILFIIVISTSCVEDDPRPKPAAMMALQYPESSYKEVEATSCPFKFEVNTYARVLSKNDCSMKIEYPKMDATIFVDYAPVHENINELLIDGQKLSISHNRMADVIDDKIYINPDQGVYGMFYSIEGNAASNVQFYATDSIRNFVTASLYFNRKPNYDSLYPAVDYIKLDMRQMMESIRWK